MKRLLSEKMKFFSERLTINPNNNEEYSKRALVIQVFFAMMANLSVLSPGMGLGFPAVTTEILLRNKELVLTPEQVSWFASVTALICPFRGPISSFCVTKFGRKGTLILINIISIIFWLIIGFSSQSDAKILFIQLIIARVLTGLAIGSMTVPALMYVTEICYPRIRGRMVVLSTPFFISSGILLIYFLGYITGVKKL